MRQQNEIVNDLNYIKNNYLEVCIFGCSSIGKGIGYDIIKFLKLNVSCYCDNNKERWGTEIKDGIKCISPDKLSQKENMACIVMVSLSNQKEVIDQLKRYHISTILTHYELMALDIVINRFLEVCSVEGRLLDENICNKKQEFHISPIPNEKNKQYAVYTCITGGYDQVTEPQYYTEECDYYLISDSKPDNLKIFKWLDVNEFVPCFVKDNSRKNRFCKIHSPSIFSEYKYSIYVDGNIQILGDVRKYIGSIGRSGIAAYKLPSWDDLYAHVMSCIILDKKALVMKQIDDYYKEGMPRHYGMFECGILIRDNTNLICKKVMEDWWKQVFRYSYRDQFSFTYCLWKNGIETSEVGILGSNLRNDKDFRKIGNHHQIGKN